MLADRIGYAQARGRGRTPVRGAPAEGSARFRRAAIERCELGVFRRPQQMRCVGEFAPDAGRIPGRRDSYRILYADIR